MRRSLSLVTRYAIKPRDRIFVNCYGIFSFAKNISKNLSGKHSNNKIAGKMNKISAQNSSETIPSKTEDTGKTPKE